MEASKKLNFLRWKKKIKKIWNKKGYDLDDYTVYFVWIEETRNNHNDFGKQRPGPHPDVLLLI